MSQKNMSETPPVHYRLFLDDWNVVEAQSESRESQQNQNETKDRGKHRYATLESYHPFLKQRVGLAIVVENHHVTEPTVKPT